MNNFLDELKEEYREGDKFRLFNKIDFEDYELSIQASSYHYSVPNKILEDNSKYLAMEIAIIKDNEFVDIFNDNFLITWLSDLSVEEISIMKMSYYGGVYIYIPVSIINSLYNYLLAND